jgi:hypothetical protein
MARDMSVPYRTGMMTGTPHIAPDGSYVGGTPVITPDGR